jgi:hypothetical protein
MKRNLSQAVLSKVLQVFLKFFNFFLSLPIRFPSRLKKRKITKAYTLFSETKKRVLSGFAEISYLEKFSPSLNYYCIYAYVRAHAHTREN